ncbi:electron transport complex subunit RsxG [Accumulibacter sp.]|uniref:electron transport complex subunit RsxG n=1 Tax=Accumulibacter sp. TaxID=2053492 RepID=UPI0025EE152C|nr:electron transport complex subunit RsxG [Accumulibacter sp.]MCP5229910.1 electron transport complex subunit RsxG [Accumulibacter sp.]
MNFSSFREKVVYQPLLLGAFALLASGALAWMSKATGDAIVAAEAADLRTSLGEVLPAGFADNDLLGDTLTIERDGWPVTIYRARQHGKVRGAVFKVAERGYAADIQLLMALDADGTTLGVRVVKHAETPGLGDKIEATKSPWIEDFAGKSLRKPLPEQWAVRKDGGAFDQFAGATITPRAVVKAVKGGLAFFSEHRQEILGEE